MNLSDYAVTAVVSTALTLLVVAPSTYWFAQQARTSIVSVATVDVQRLMLEAQGALPSPDTALNTPLNAGSNSLPVRATTLSAVAFARSLSLAVAEVGAECDCVIVNKAAVLGGDVVDYTDHIRGRLR